MSTLDAFEMDLIDTPSYVHRNILLEDVYVIAKEIKGKIEYKFYIANIEKTQAYYVNENRVTNKVKLRGSDKLDIYNFVAESIDGEMAVNLKIFPDLVNDELRKLYYDFEFNEKGTSYKEIKYFIEYLKIKLEKSKNNCR